MLLKLILKYIFYLNQQLAHHILKKISVKSFSNSQNQKKKNKQIENSFHLHRHTATCFTIKK